MPDLLRLDGVRAGYGATVVLEDVGLGLVERDSLAVLGRNGVGKTTLLGTIVGHTTLHGGSSACSSARGAALISSTSTIILASRPRSLRWPSQCRSSVRVCGGASRVRI